MDIIRKIPTTVLYPDMREVPKETEVVSEHILDILVNERPVYRLVCSKNHLKELVVGRLKTDGLIESTDDVDRIFFCKYENEASVFLNRDISWQENAVNPELSCCTGNRVLSAARKSGLKKLPKYEWRREWVFELAGEFAKGTDLHDRTCGTHACILAMEGKALFTGEDIGRHNAVDKAVGYAMQNGIELGRCMLFTSGRVPTDMVEKVIAAGVPILVSKAAPTAESAKMAARYGLTLICRARPDRCEILRQGDGSFVSENE